MLSCKYEVAKTYNWLQLNLDFRSSKSFPEQFEGSSWIEFHRDIQTTGTIQMELESWSLVDILDCH